MQINMKTDLKDVTFTIPVRIDSQDRVFNLQYIIKYLSNNFDTNIIIYENGPTAGKLELNLPNVEYVFEINTGVFHRTRYLNQMTRLAQTKFIVNYDCDVLFPIKQIVKAVNLLRNNTVDYCYPYSGLFVNIPKTALNETFTVDNLDSTKYPNFGNNSVGGAVIWNKDVFVAGGMENENFISWGAEDWERMRRFLALGYRPGRVNGPLYHIEHSRTRDSSESNPHYVNNTQEYNRIVNMTKDGLLKEIKTWPWLSE
jgi:predicted glycosyltransferase involved in capsule biosynthesis